MEAPDNDAFRGLSRLVGTILGLLRRVLAYPVSIATLIEAALWLAVPYLIAGLAWSFFHPDGIERVQTQLEQQFHLPAGSAYEMAAVAEVTVLWPVALLLPSHACAT